MRLIVHIVDISGSEGRDPVDDYNKINAELATYSEKLAAIPQIVVAGKADLLTDRSEIEKFEKAIGKKVFVVSSVTHEGLDELLSAMKQKVDELPPPQRIERDEDFELEPKSDQKFTVSRMPDGSFFVDGGLVDFLIQNVTISSQDSFAFFQKVLKDRGVIAELKKKGMKEGDIVTIGDIEFDGLTDKRQNKITRNTTDLRFVSDCKRVFFIAVFSMLRFANSHNRFFI